MNNGKITLTESELHSLIKECVKEMLKETGGFSLGTANRGLKDYQKAKSNKINFISSPSGTIYDVDKRLKNIKNTGKQARERLLSYFASEPFLFTAELEHSNTHIIEYTVLNIIAVRNNEVLLDGQWFDTDTDEKIIKKIKVNCDTKSVMYYNPYLKSTRATLNKETYTRGKWDAFVKELTKLRDENNK